VRLSPRVRAESAGVAVRFTTVTRRLSGLLIRDETRARRDVLWALATGLAVVGITAVRIPKAWDSIWAEDGTIFLTDARNSGIAAFGHFYSGYLHVAPRIGALIADTLPIRWAATSLSTFAVLTAAACAVMIEVASGAHINARWVRVGLGLSVGFLPALTVESLANVANLQFILLFALFWTLLWLPRRPFGQVSGALLAALTGFSSLLGVVLVPLALLRLTTKRGRPIAAALLISIGVHIGLVLAYRPGRGGPQETLPLGEVARTYGLILDSHLIGGPFGDVHHTLLQFVGVLAVVAVVGVVLVRSKSPDRPRRLLLAGLTVALSGIFYLVETLTIGIAFRYQVIPAFFLVGAIAVAADAAMDLEGRARAVGVAVPVLAVLLSAVWSFTPAPIRTEGPRWSDGLAGARTTCASSHADSVQITILPALEGSWVLTLSCRVVDP
jgi:hypothetical protein